MADTRSTQLKEKKVAVIGSGLTGRSWCMLFACAGYKVSLYDVDPNQASEALTEIRTQLEMLQKEGLPRGTLTVQEQYERISVASSVTKCLQDAFYVQENVPERLELKRKVWAEVDRHVTGDVILASSTCALLPSQISENLTNRARFVVVHPTNPPFYIPLVELVRAPWTADDVIPGVDALMKELGQDPIILNKEVPGFVLNRIQYAIFGEGWRLIRDGLLSVEDVDKILSSGLGLRYAFMGPFKTAHLNGFGFIDCIRRYRNSGDDIKNDLGEPDLMTGSTVERIQKDLEKTVGPISELAKIRQQRDRCLLHLSKLKKDLDAQAKK